MKFLITVLFTTLLPTIWATSPTAIPVPPGGHGPVQPIVAFYSGPDLTGDVYRVYQPGFRKTFICSGCSTCPDSDPRLPFVPADYLKNFPIGFVPMSIRKQDQVQVRLWSNFGNKGDNWCGPSNIVVTQQTGTYANYSHIAYDKWTQQNAAPTGVFEIFGTPLVPLVVFYSGADLTGNSFPVYDLGFYKTLICSGCSQCPTSDPRLPFVPADYLMNSQIGFIPLSIWKDASVQVKLWSGYGNPGDTWCGPSNIVVTQQTGAYANYSHIAYNTWIQNNAAQTGVFQIYAA